MKAADTTYELAICRNCSMHWAQGTHYEAGPDQEIIKVRDRCPFCQLIKREQDALISFLSLRKSHNTLVSQVKNLDAQVTALINAIRESTRPLSERLDIALGEQLAASDPSDPSNLSEEY